MTRIASQRGDGGRGVCRTCGQPIYRKPDRLAGPVWFHRDGNWLYSLDGYPEHEAQPADTTLKDPR